jgi:DNA replication licensing factor MCM5
MAGHVVNLHMGIIQNEAQNSEIDIDLLRKYIGYAKMKCAPRLSEEAGAVLKDFYVKDR